MLDFPNTWISGRWELQSLTYEMKMKPYMEYWEDILYLSRSLPLQSAILLQGFWPSSN